jgi:predicted dinucleotide-binding enzyme
VGSRTPEKAELVAWKAATKGAVSTGTFAEAAEFGELLVLCCLGEVSEEVIRLAGTARFDGKILIDATNALDFSKGMPPGLFVWGTESLGERHQKMLPKARVVKCFNIVSNPVMVHPQVGGDTPTMIIAGNDDDAKEAVVGILKEFGWPGAVDIGPIEGARWLEALVPLWVRVALKLNNFNVAFKLLT